MASKEKSATTTIAGIRVPNSLTQTAADAANSPVGRVIIAEALDQAADMLVRNTPNPTTGSGVMATTKNFAGAAGDATADLMHATADHLKASAGMVDPMARPLTAEPAPLFAPARRPAKTRKSAARKAKARVGAVRSAKAKSKTKTKAKKGKAKKAAKKGALSKKAAAKKSAASRKGGKAKKSAAGKKGGKAKSKAAARKGIAAKKAGKGKRAAKGKRAGKAKGAKRS